MLNNTSVIPQYKCALMTNELTLCPVNDSQILETRLMYTFFAFQFQTAEDLQYSTSCKSCKDSICQLLLMLAWRSGLQLPAPGLSGSLSDVWAKPLGFHIVKLGHDVRYERHFDITD